MATLMLLNPRKKTRRRKARRNPVAANPRRRRRVRRAARRNPRMYSRPRRRRARRNPINVGNVKGVLMPAVIGGAGSVGLDVLFSMLPLPAQFKTGMLGGVVKIAAAIMIPNLFKGVIGKRNADIISLAAATVQAATQIRVFAAQSGVPGLSAYDEMGAYVDGMGAYIPNMGYANAAPGVTGPMYDAYGQQMAGISDYSPSDGMSEADYF